MVVITDGMHHDTADQLAAARDALDHAAVTATGEPAAIHAVALEPVAMGAARARIEGVAATTSLLDRIFGLTFHIPCRRTGNPFLFLSLSHHPVYISPLMHEYFIIDTMRGVILYACSANFTVGMAIPVSNGSAMGVDSSMVCLRTRNDVVFILFLPLPFPEKLRDLATPGAGGHTKIFQRPGHFAAYPAAGSAEWTARDRFFSTLARNFLRTAVCCRAVPDCAVLDTVRSQQLGGKRVLMFLIFLMGDHRVPPSLPPVASAKLERCHSAMLAVGARRATLHCAAR